MFGQCTRFTSFNFQCDERTSQVMEATHDRSAVEFSVGTMKIFFPSVMWRAHASRRCRHVEGSISEKISNYTHCILAVAEKVQSPHILWHGYRKKITPFLSRFYPSFSSFPFHIKMHKLHFTRQENSEISMFYELFIHIVGGIFEFFNFLR